MAAIAFVDLWELALAMLVSCLPVVACLVFVIVKMPKQYEGR